MVAHDKGRRKQAANDGQTRSWSELVILCSLLLGGRMSVRVWVWACNKQTEVLARHVLCSVGRDANVSGYLGVPAQGLFL